MPQLESLHGELRTALLSLDRLAANQIILRQRESVSLCEVVDDLVVPVLEDIGEGWERGEIALSEVYMSGRLAESAVEGLFTGDRDELVRSQPRIGIVVLEDSHVLGKRIVLGLMHAAGYEVADFGGGVSIDETVRKVREHDIQVLLVSVLMLRSALLVRDLRARLAEEGLDVRIAVGGAPFRLDSSLWQEVGADACGASASDVFGIVSRLSEAG